MKMNESNGSRKFKTFSEEIGGMTRSKKRDGNIQRLTKKLFSMVILSITEIQRSVGF